MTALDLGVTHGNIVRRIGEVLRLLREEAEPPITKEESIAHQDAHGGQNLTTPKFTRPPVPGSLGGPRGPHSGSLPNVASLSSEALPRDPQDKKSEAYALELQNEEYSKDIDKKRKAAPSPGSDVEEEAAPPKKKVKKTKEEKEAKKQRKAAREEEEKAELERKRAK